MDWDSMLSLSGLDFSKGRRIGAIARPRGTLNDVGLVQRRHVLGITHSRLQLVLHLDLRRRPMASWHRPQRLPYSQVDPLLRRPLLSLGSILLQHSLAIAPLQTIIPRFYNWIIFCKRVKLQHSAPVDVAAAV